MRKIGVILFLALILVSCASPVPPVPPTSTISPTQISTATSTGLPAAPSSPTATVASSETETTAPTPTIQPSPTAKPPVPDFAHIIIFFFENHEYDSINGSSAMPNYNRYLQDNTVLTQYYAVTHPSLPNYIATFSGDTFKITSDCTGCFVDAPSLPDQIESSGRTWKAYLEDMPSPCFVGSSGEYVQKHNPFIYFDPIRQNADRCQKSIVPLAQLQTDLAAGQLPNFAFIMANECNSGHDAYKSTSCGLSNTDNWLETQMKQLEAYLQPRAESEPYLIILTWDEGQGSHSCCGLPKSAGGRVATVLVSPLAKSSFQDDTPYTHYSLLKTIETAWSLPYLGHAGDDSNVIITLPWK